MQVLGHFQHFNIFYRIVIYTPATQLLGTDRV